MVFDDTITTTGGDGYVYIQFEEPYFYDGTSNLIVQHYCYNPSFLFAVSDMLATVSTENIRVNCQFDWHEIDLEDLPWPFPTRTDYPYTTFVIDPLDDIGVISGIVYDGNNIPLEGAVMSVEGTTVTDTSAADGSYGFPTTGSRPHIRATRREPRRQSGGDN